MFWLEMSRDETHGGGDWSFTESLWSPARNQKGNKSGFWETVLSVRKGDQILHLRGKSTDAAFVGLSTAATNGYETSERPPNPKSWSYARSFYRVHLEGFQSFATPINLNAVFVERYQDLLAYFKQNRLKHANKRRLFYVRQAGGIQCQNGAYLTEVDDTLAGILFGESYIDETAQPDIVVPDLVTSEQIRLLKARVGQREFSLAVRENYSGTCCFPGCDVCDDTFLVGAHIDRWADNEVLRGSKANGLCFCLMHDRAFEIGLFTVDEKLAIIPNHDRISAQNNIWGTENIVPYEGCPIRKATTPPSITALRAHWKRIGFAP